ncbi:hypothetical protein FRB90_012777, partial [Tulasnella sp. 427]
LHPRNALSAGVIDAHYLWQLTPHNIRANADEERRFVHYLAGSQTTIDSVLEQVVQLKLETEKVAGRRNLPNGGQLDEDDNAYDDEVQELDRRCEAKWGAQAYFCDDSALAIISEFFFHWWMNRVDDIKNAQRQRNNGNAVTNFIAGWTGGSQPPQAPGLPEDCWYGFECRTQRSNSVHASRYNHVCLNTHPGGAAVRPGRAG